MSRIKLISHPYAIELLRARTDMAIVYNSELVERPYWYEDTETGQLFYDIYACMAYPSDVTDESFGMPGYACIVGVVRPNKDLDSNNPLNAKFQLIDEIESDNVHTLLRSCLDLRDKYGYGEHKGLFDVWYGDPDRFHTTLALLNEELDDKRKDSALLISPPEDFYEQKKFDIYVRDLGYVLAQESKRLYPGYNYILQNRLMAFKRDDPCILAIGGLVHTLLCRCRWMQSQEETAFVLEY